MKEIVDITKKRIVPEQLGDHYSFLKVVEKDGNIILKLPKSLIKKHGWKPGDVLEWSDTVVLTDDGDYQSVCLINVSLEKRMCTCQA
ncbi:hypothetical protein CMI47_07300 [Candidatus Pacearchaeota archaeon]|nr:hypothetical protein [Candidatus Pacearchaeota archaeon]